MAHAYHNNSLSYTEKKEYAKAKADYEQNIKVAPDDAMARNDYAWLLATCADAEARDGKKAVEHATHACRKTDWKNASFLDTLAAAHAEAGQFEEAVQRMQQAR